MKHALCLVLLLVVACQSEQSEESRNDMSKKSKGPEPDYVTVDHILIGVRNPRMPGASRDEKEARELAYKLLDEVRNKDGDWAALKRKYSDDPPPGGPYSMANKGVRPRSPNDYPRTDMVPAFGNVGFQLEVGEIGIADYSPASPFGFHLIKRVR